MLGETNGEFVVNRKGIAMMHQNMIKRHPKPYLMYITLEDPNQDIHRLLTMKQTYAINTEPTDAFRITNEIAIIQTG